MKKILALFTSAAMVFSLAVVPAYAAENEVASIGDQKYETLNAAVEAVKDGETITLLQDVPNATGISVASGKKFTIDFGGHTYTLSGPGEGSSGTETNGFQLLQGSNITFKNGTVSVSENPNNIKIIIQNYANLTLEDMRFEAGNLSDGDYALSFNNGNIVFKGTTSVITDSPNITAFDVCKFSSYPSVTVTFDDDYTGTIDGPIVYDSTDAETHQLIIKGNGTFETIKKSAEACANPNIQISGGTFADTNVLPYLTEGAEVKVVLNKDVTEDVVVPANTKVTLDLNGHTITNVKSNTITNFGDLTIEGKGTVDNVTHAKAALSNEAGATAVLNGGNYLRSKETGSSPEAGGSNSYYNIVNHGFMTINEGVTVKQSGRFSSLVENGWYNGNQNTSGKDSEMYINGGTFSGGINTIKNDDYGYLEISGGTFENVTQAALLNWNEAVIEGGNFLSDGNVVLNGYLNDTMDKGILDIYGGTFKGGAGKDVFALMAGGQTPDSLDNVTVYGGTFSSDVSDFVGDNLKAVKTDDGNFIVVPVTAGVVLNPNTLTLTEGDTAQINATLTPEDAVDTLTWSSSDEKVAVVDETGKVTAIAAGKATIRATTSNGKSAVCEVNVTAKESDITVDVPIVDPDADQVEVDMSAQDSKEAQEVIGGTIAKIDTVTGNDQAVVKAINEALEAGKDIQSEVKVEKVDAKEVAKDEAAAVSSAVKQLQAKVKGDSATIAQYLDISVLVKAEGETIGTLNQLGNTVTFTLAIPETLQKEGRQFYVIRVHDGEVTKVASRMNADGTLSFETDRFSTYALVYVDGAQEAYLGNSEVIDPDKEIITPNDPQEEKPSGEDEQPNKEDENPATSAAMMGGLFAGMMILSGAIVIVLQKKKKLNQQ